MKVEVVTCNHCGRDLTETGNCEDYRIVVASEEIPNPGPTATAMSSPPEIRRPLHFCGTSHLAQWVYARFNAEGRQIAKL